ncbi:MAG: efflux RND transporter periplasmic adaptor subunit [Vicinamibacteraceae bacterium]|nr:efflux RND transporter periplasmic adaptor subunit [Vicinamibacteraceae bacterium]
MTSRTKKILIGVGILVVGGAVVAANLAFRRQSGKEVTAETITTRALEAIVSASGTIQAKRSVNISADTMGRVTDLAVNEGQSVKRGDFLMQIDPRNLESAVQRTQAGVAASEATLQQMRSAVISARENLALAQQNFKRQQDLWAEQLTTREAFDRAETELKLREAELREREQAVRTQEARIRQERAGLSSARYDLSKVRITSPIDGLITRRNIEEGETVVIGTMNNPGTVLLTIADMSVIEAEVEVDETDIPSMQIGQIAKVTIDAIPNKTFTGKVTEIGNSPIQTTAAGAGQQATNFKVVVTLDGQIPEVRPGFTCTAEITTATRPKALAVPIQAMAVRDLVFDAKGNIVREKPEGDQRRRRSPEAAAQAAARDLPEGQTRKETEGVFVLRSDAAEFVPVTTGIAGERHFEVLSGLKEGDRVVTGPYATVRDLQDGDKVKVQENSEGGRR